MISRKKVFCTKKFLPLVYLVNHVEIQYCVIAKREAMVFATRGSHFIPRGEAPRDEMRLPRVSKTIASQLGDHATVLLQSLLNKNNLVSRKFSSNLQKFLCRTAIFHQFDEIYCTPQGVQKYCAPQGVQKYCRSL